MPMTEEEKKLRKYYGYRARKEMLADWCERCGSITKLEIHHKNLDWKDNSKENIETLCRKCHVDHHKKNGQMKVPGPKVPCRICGKPYKIGSSRKDLCNTHRIRLKRHGNFEKTKEKKKRPCPICNRMDFLTKGLCNAHYLRLKKWGDPYHGGPLQMQYSRPGNTNKKKSQKPLKLDGSTGS